MDGAFRIGGQASVVHAEYLDVIAAANRVVASDEQPEQNIEYDRDGECRPTLAFQITIIDPVTYEDRRQDQYDGDKQTAFCFCPLDDEQQKAQQQGEND